MEINLIDVARRAGAQVTERPPARLNEKPGPRANWRPEDIRPAGLALDFMMESAGAKPGEVCALEGTMPHSLAVHLQDRILSRGLKPAIVDPHYGNGTVTVPLTEPVPGGNFLHWRYTEMQGFTLVKFEIPNVFMNVRNLDQVQPPAVNPRKGIVISGHGPYWLTGCIGLAYRNYPWVAMCQKCNGATVALRQPDQFRRVGSTMTQEEIDKAVMEVIAPEQGQVWYHDTPDGSRHPCIIMSADRRNAQSKVVMIIPCTSNVLLHGGNAATVAFEAGQYGFKVNTVALCHYQTTISKDLLIGPPVGKVSPADIEKLKDALGFAIRSDS